MELQQAIADARLELASNPWKLYLLGGGGLVAAGAWLWIGVGSWAKNSNTIETAAPMAQREGQTAQEPGQINRISGGDFFMPASPLVQSANAHSISASWNRFEAKVAKTKTPRIPEDTNDPFRLAVASTEDSVEALKVAAEKRRLLEDSEEDAPIMRLQATTLGSRRLARIDGQVYEEGDLVSNVDDAEESRSKDSKRDSDRPFRLEKVSRGEVIVSREGKQYRLSNRRKSVRGASVRQHAE